MTMTQSFDHGNFRHHDLSGRNSVIQEVDENGGEEELSRLKHGSDSRGSEHGGKIPRTNSLKCMLADASTRCF